MADPSPDDSIAAHVASIATRDARDAERLAHMLLQRSWPGGSGDRSEPGALAWLRRWRPRGPAPPPLACACAGGRCPLCN